LCINAYTLVGLGTPTGRLWKFGGQVRRGGIQLPNLTFPVELLPIKYLCANGPGGGTALDVDGSTKLIVHDQTFPKRANARRCVPPPAARKAR